MFKFKIYNSFSDDLKLVWRDFEKSSFLHVFQTYDWCKHWFEIIGEKEKYKLFIVKISDENNNEIMLLPLVKKRHFHLWKIEWIGGIQFDYKGPICNQLYSWSEAHFEIMLKQLKQLSKKYNASYFLLTNQPELIQNYYNPFYKYMYSYKSHKSSHIDFTLESDYFKKISLKKIINDSDRQRKRLQIFGELKFSISRNTQDFSLQVEKMISQKQIQYTSNNIQNLLKFDHVKNFYRFSFDKKISKVHMSALEINNKIISTHWGAIYKNRFYYMMPSYERGEMSKYSTGKILLEELIKWAIENKFEIFDFTIGGENYKKDWCNSEMSLSDSVVPINIFGNIVSIHIILKQKIYTFLLRKIVFMKIYRNIKNFKF